MKKIIKHLHLLLVLCVPSSALLAALKKKHTNAALCSTEVPINNVSYPSNNQASKPILDKEGATPRLDNPKQSLQLKFDPIFEQQKTYDINTLAAMQEKIKNITPQDLRDIVKIPSSEEEKEDLAQTLIEYLSTCLHLAYHEERTLFAGLQRGEKELEKIKRILKEKKYTPQPTETNPQPVTRVLEKNELEFLPLLIKFLEKEEKEIKFAFLRVAQETRELTKELEVLLQWKVQSAYCKAGKPNLKKQVETMTQQVKTVLCLSSSKQSSRSSDAVQKIVQALYKEARYKNAQCESSKFAKRIESQFKNNLSYIQTTLLASQKNALQRIQGNISALRKQYYYASLARKEADYQDAYRNATKSAHHIEQAERKSQLQLIFLCEKQQLCLDLLEQVENYKLPYLLEEKVNLNTLHQEDTYNKVRLGILQTLYEVTYQAKILQEEQGNLNEARSKMYKLGKIDHSHPTTLSPKTYLDTPRHFYLKSLIKTFDGAFKSDAPIITALKKKESEKSFRQYSDINFSGPSELSKILNKAKAGLDVIIDKRVRLLKRYQKKLKEKICYYKGMQEDQGKNTALIIKAKKAYVEYFEHIYNIVQMEILSLPLLKKELLQSKLPDFYQPFCFNLFQNAYTQGEIKDAQHNLSKTRRRICEQMNAFESRIQSIQGKISNHLIIAHTPRIQKLIRETQLKKAISEHNSCIAEDNLVQIRFQDLGKILEERRKVAQALGMAGRLGATTGMNCTILLTIGAVTGPVGILIVASGTGVLSTLAGKVVEDLYMNGGDMQGTQRDLVSFDTASQLLTRACSTLLTQGITIKVIPLAAQKLLSKETFDRFSEFATQLQETPSLIDAKTRIPCKMAIEFHNAFCGNITGIFTGDRVNSVLERASGEIQASIPSSNPQNPHYTATHKKQYLKSRLGYGFLDASIQAMAAPITQELGQWNQRKKYTNTISKETFFEYFLHKTGHFAIGSMMGSASQFAQNQVPLYNLRQEQKQGKISKKEYEQRKVQLKDSQKGSIPRAALAGGMGAMSAEITTDFLDDHFVQPKEMPFPETQEEWKRYKRNWQLRKKIAAMAGKSMGIGAGYVCGNTEIGQRTAQNAVNNNYLYSCQKPSIWSDKDEEERQREEEERRKNDERRKKEEELDDEWEKEQERHRQEEERLRKEWEKGRKKEEELDDEWEKEQERHRQQEERLRKEWEKERERERQEKEKERERQEKEKLFNAAKSIKSLSKKMVCPDYLPRPTKNPLFPTKPSGWKKEKEDSPKPPWDNWPPFFPMNRPIEENKRKDQVIRGQAIPTVSMIKHPPIKHPRVKHSLSKERKASIGLGKSMMPPDYIPRSERPFPFPPEESEEDEPFPSPIWISSNHPRHSGLRSIKNRSYPGVPRISCVSKDLSWSDDGDAFEQNGKDLRDKYDKDWREKNGTPPPDTAPFSNTAPCSHTATKPHPKIKHPKIKHPPIKHPPIKHSLSKERKASVGLEKSMMLPDYIPRSERPFPFPPEESEEDEPFPSPIWISSNHPRHSGLRSIKNRSYPGVPRISCVSKDLSWSDDGDAFEQNGKDLRDKYDKDWREKNGTPPPDTAPFPPTAPCSHTATKPHPTIGHHRVDWPWPPNDLPERPDCPDNQRIEIIPIMPRPPSGPNSDPSII